MEDNPSAEQRARYPGDSMDGAVTGATRRVFLRDAGRAAVALAGLALGAARPADPYTFAVVPQFEPRRLFTIWRPIVEEVSRRTGLALTLEAALSVHEFENALSSGLYDFIYSNPYHVFRERHRQGYVPLVRDDVPLHAIIVVRRDSPLRTVEELDGKVIAVPSPNASATLLPRAELLRRHGVRIRILNARTHSSAYLHVATGLAVAATGVDKTLQEQPADVRDALRVVFRTQDYASHPIAVHPRLPPEVGRKVQRALLELAATPQGAALFARIPMTRPVEACAADYEALAALRLDQFWEAD